MPHEPTIGLVTEDDLESLTELWSEAFATGPDRVRNAPFTPQEGGRLAAQGECFVIVRDGEVKAATVLARHDEQAANLVSNKHEGQLLLVAVAADSRRSGLGRAIVHHAITRSREENLEALWLWSRPSQTAAHLMYESLGFVREPKLDGAVLVSARLAFFNQL
jgi:ribosomal protein S18 acetylase RimI-like enzyme